MSSLKKIFSLLILSLLTSKSFCLNVYTCGTVVVDQKQFLVQSDLILEKYPANKKCEILLKSDQNCENIFNFQFLLFDLEDSRGCVKDRLEIFNQDALCGQKSGTKNYKSENGELRLRFISDDTNSGRGFQILVTKQPCGTSRDTTVEKIPNCCSDEYRLRKFYLASPNFPYPAQKTDCIFKIFRANPNICRLRLYFKYFSTNCLESFLEVDGRKICGCKLGLNVVSDFDKNYQNNPKILRYVNNGDQNYFRGFILEVIQDECPDKFIPESRALIPQLFYYNDQLNKVETNLEDAKLISAENLQDSTKNSSNMESADPLGGSHLLNKRSPPSNVFHYYFYEAPEDLEEEQLKESESRDYLDVPEADVPSFDEEVCRNWGVYDFNKIKEDILWKQMSQCGKEVGRECTVVNMESGHLYSPGYPYYYGSNLDLCYRFPKGNGCGYKIFMNDFALEQSFQCQKDAFILYNRRYCGYSLMRSQFLIDLSQKDYEDIYFKTDASGCGRGFHLYFQRLPCGNLPNQNQPSYNCGGEIIGRQQFEIAIPKTGHDCSYDIKKFNRDVCKMHLFFNSDLDCRVEYLLIQNKQYCGYLQGRDVMIDFVQTDVIRISYHAATMRPVMSSVFIKGQQINNNCYRVPTAQ